MRLQVYDDFNEGNVFYKNQQVVVSGPMPIYTTGSGAFHNTFDLAYRGQHTIYENEVFFADSALEAIKNSDAILILTEWEEFKNIDWDTAYESMRHPSWLFDTRNIVLEKDLQNLGFKVWQLGKS